MLNKLSRVINEIKTVLELQSKNIDLLTVTQSKTANIITSQQQHIEDLEDRIMILEKQLHSLTDKTCH